MRLRIDRDLEIGDVRDAALPTGGDRHAGDHEYERQLVFLGGVVPNLEQLFERHLLHRQMELRALLRERAGQVPLRHDRIVPQGLDRRTDNAVLVGLPELRRRYPEWAVAR